LHERRIKHLYVIGHTNEIYMFKKKIAIEKLCSQFINELYAETQIDYKELKNSIQSSEYYGSDFIIQDDDNAFLEMYLARIALETVRIDKMHEKKQSEKIISNIFASLNLRFQGENYINKIDRYHEVTLKSFDSYGDTPFDLLAESLLEKWIGAEIKKFKVVLENKIPTNYTSPVLLLLISTQLIEYNANWANYNKKYKLK